MPQCSVLVVASGAPHDAVVDAPPVDLVIAADGGVASLLAAGRTPDLVVGDADSAAPEALAAAEAAGAEIRHHPPTKDESDLELALEEARRSGATAIHVIAADGGRLDHQLGNLAVLASPRWSARLDARIGDHRVWVVRGRRELPLVVGDHLALQAIGGPARGVRTGGVRFELHGEDLDPFVARGIANEVSEAAPWVEVADGVVLAISSPTPSSGHGAAR